MFDSFKPLLNSMWCNSIIPLKIYVSHNFNGKSLIIQKINTCYYLSYVYRIITSFEKAFSLKKEIIMTRHNDNAQADVESSTWH